MCGIAGWIDLDGEVDAGIVDSQVRTMEHRGPDSTGFHEGRWAALGRSRLAVIDLATGDPPITDEDGSRGVVPER